jgi:branched-chain amino acid transport system substrate-binding protein
VLATAVCPAAQDAEAPDSIKIGAVVPLTGAFAGAEAQVERGCRYGVEAINEAGGVYVEELGTSLPLELDLRDDESDPNRTTAIMEDLYGEGIVAYLGGFGSPVHAAGTVIAEKNATPYLGVATALQALHEQGYRYYFSPFPKSPDIAVSVFEMLNGLIPEGERPTRVGIFQAAPDWGEELAAGWIEQAPAHGYEFYRITAGHDGLSDLIFMRRRRASRRCSACPPTGRVRALQADGELGWPEFSLVVRAADVPT